MAGKGGGAWKVAYADFVTAMMAFFLVMWITAQNKPVKESIAKYFSDPFATGDERGPLSAQRTGSNIPSPDPENAGGTTNRRQRMRTKDPGNPTRNGTTVYFDVASAELTPAAQDQLLGIARQMGGKPNKIEIRGHAARTPVPPESGYRDAWELSYARCMASMRFLTSKGIRPERIRLSQGGSYEPRPSPTNEYIPADDSRVEIFALGEFVHSPQVSMR